MPELPEVETTCRGIAPHIEGREISQVQIYQPSLRWPISKEVAGLAGAHIEKVSRRGKYILLNLNARKNLKNNAKLQQPAGTLIIHLGMSGSLRICDKTMDLRKHDHVEISVGNNTLLRYHDPRRFGCVLWTGENPLEHTLLSKLGPEPLSDDFTGEHLFRLSRKRKANLKNFIMDSHIIVGVGNIYAAESLFCSGLRPGRSAARVTRAQYELLATHIKRILANAIKQGGTTLRDFVNSDGQPGYFSQQLLVYGRAGEACTECGDTIKNKVIGQRSSFYCPSCQS